jgi:putative phage-type endonuclease
MTAIRSPHRQNTPDWVDARRNVVGSSDIPIITGNSPYRTSLFSLWAIKTRIVEPEPIDPATQEVFDIGHALEPYVADRYTLATGLPVRRMPAMLVSAEHPWQGASIDRRRGQRIIECKVVLHRRWATDGPEPVPAYVQDQVQWQLGVTGWDVADVAMLVPGEAVQIHTVERNDGYIDDLRYLAQHMFWDYVVAGERPPVDGSESTTATLTRMYPAGNETMLAPTPEIDALAATIRDTRAAVKAAEEADRLARNALRLVLGNHEGATTDDVAVENPALEYRLYWRRSPDRDVTTTDWEAVARAYRAMIEDATDSDRLALRGAAPDDLDGIEAEHTTTETREGTRTLRPYFRDEETGRWT